MAIEVYDMRLSFIWTETFTELLQDSNGRPLSFLGRSFTYEPEFGRLLSNPKATAGPGLKLPWLAIRHQGFWRAYFAGQAPPNARTCWRQIVPLRGPLPLGKRPSWLQGRVFGEGFFYPHGLALAVTAVYKGKGLSLEDSMKLARKIRKTGQFNANWPGGSAQPVGLKTLADSALDHLREIALGPGGRPGTRSREPFSILTVVQGSGVDFEEPVEGSQVHQFLEVTSSWTNRWRNPYLPPLEEVSLDLGLWAENDVLYARKRGRVVWFPQHFSEDIEPINSLSCYHRNLLLASMTVESLTGLASETIRLQQTGRPLSSDFRTCARNAARILGQFYGGAESTYGNMSLLRQIEENGYQETINDLRRYFNMYELIPRK